MELYLLSPTHHSWSYSYLSRGHLYLYLNYSSIIFAVRMQIFAVAIPLAYFYYFVSEDSLFSCPSAVLSFDITDGFVRNLVQASCH